MDHERPWKEFETNVPSDFLALFASAPRVTVGNGKDTLFWEDRWLDEVRLQEFAPALYAFVSARAKATRVVYYAVTLGSWVQDVTPNMAFNALLEYLDLWKRLGHVQLEDTLDSIAWSWKVGGNFLVRSAYATEFTGREVAPTADFTWKSRAPLQCCFFTRLALRNRRWTSDRLAWRGLLHQDTCPF
ncbi:hypothetical protein ZWY2020_018125 [Hordeum vulgare]|nr:hypothetical protein ZWY2020_018125 [Hordeum vulgare]